MMTIVGMVVVIVSIIAGYLMEHGNLSILIQPAEVVIIMGAAVGSLIIMAGSQLGVVAKSFIGVFKAKHHGKKEYLQLLMLLNHLFSKAQREGLIALESHLDNPKKSDIFSKYPIVMHDPSLLAFITDNLRLIITASMSANDLDNLLEIDIETQHKESLFAPGIITKISDALPGLGIVAAVLGVTLAMGKITEPPEVLGETVAAALVGTFLGILACYGYVGPIATNLEHQADQHSISFSVIKMALIGFSQGSHPLLAVEAGRRAIPSRERPTFTEVDDEVRKWKEKK
jgi:chemotaxis protein MotA